MLNLRKTGNFSLEVTILPLQAGNSAARHLSVWSARMPPSSPAKCISVSFPCYGTLVGRNIKLLTQPSRQLGLDNTENYFVTVQVSGVLIHESLCCVSLGFYCTDDFLRTLPLGLILSTTLSGFAATSSICFTLRIIRGPTQIYKSQVEKMLEPLCKTLGSLDLKGLIDLVEQDGSAFCSSLQKLNATVAYLLITSFEK